MIVISDFINYFLFNNHLVIKEISPIFYDNPNDTNTFKCPFYQI